MILFRYKNGNEVSADARIKITKEGTETYNLTVTLLKLEDTGDYEVKATNEQGTVSSVTKVTVSSKCNTKVKCLLLYYALVRGTRPSGIFMCFGKLEIPPLF